ncbi:hypothetical protein ACFQE5_21015 [Pseudonocardia hispaniensis]|uniref:Uncharacterized protein n=1 Tax=Pseudonocardia hispaniensis TaxID=904933 RepID=A0ABW1J7N8_9PSEU
MTDDETTGTRHSCPVVPTGPGHRSGRLRLAAYAGGVAGAAILGMVGVSLVAGPGIAMFEVPLVEAPTRSAGEHGRAPGTELAPVVEATAPATNRWTAGTDDPRPAQTAAAPVPPVVDASTVVASAMASPSPSTSAPAQTRIRSAR